MTDSVDTVSTRTEIISVASGKGGTGKTVILASLGYALQQSGHRVLFVDADTATDGLSLFLLGPQGVEIKADLRQENTFAGYLEAHKTDQRAIAAPFKINRGKKDDHGQIYNGIISGRGLYGDRIDEIQQYSTPDISRDLFRSAAQSLFADLRGSKKWDYVLVDTRGGFSFGTTDICALSDKFFLVTEPAFTSFYQDKSLIHLISDAATQMNLKPELRGIIVNKATEFAEVEMQGTRSLARKLNLDAIEPSFRNLIMDEFTLRYSDTYPIPLDIDAVSAYKSQKIPYVTFPGCAFSYATLVAFSGILRIVTVQWQTETIGRWNALVDKVSDAIQEENRVKIAQVEGIHLLEIENKRLEQENKFYNDQLIEVKETQRQSFAAEAQRAASQFRERQRLTFIQLGAAIGVIVFTFIFGWSYVRELRRQIDDQQTLLNYRLEERRTLTGALESERQRYDGLRVQLDRLQAEILKSQQPR